MDSYRSNLTVDTDQIAHSLAGKILQARLQVLFADHRRYDAEGKTDQANECNAKELEIMNMLYSVRRTAGGGFVIDDKF